MGKKIHTWFYASFADLLGDKLKVLPVLFSISKVVLD
jgi:hypothetical protein